MVLDGPVTDPLLPWAVQSCPITPELTIGEPLLAGGGTTSLSADPELWSDRTGSHSPRQRWIGEWDVWNHGAGASISPPVCGYSFTNNPISNDDTKGSWGWGGNV